MENSTLGAMAMNRLGASEAAAPSRPLGLEGMFKILVIDKSVERVLTLVSS